jgi:uncharacterized protein (DUF362 family)
MRDRATVSLTKLHAQAPTYRVEREMRVALERINAIENLRKKGRTILLKPNIASPGALYSTNPSVTVAVAKLLVETGFDVMIGENPSIPTDATDAYDEYGLDDIARYSGARIVDLRNGPHVTVEVPNGRLFSSLVVSKHVVDADIIVSVATMKSANIVTATLGIKNMKGAIPSHYKRRFHCEGLNDGIADLMKVVRPDLTIIDATFGKDMTTSTCFPVGLLIASLDPLAADSVCARIMGFDPREIEHLRLVGEAGLGTMDEETIEIVGEQISAYAGMFPFSTPRDPIAIAEASGGTIELKQGNPCSVCMNELGTVLYLFQDRLSQLPETTILVGPHAAADGDVSSDRVSIGFGNCVQKKACQYRITGCPPTDYREAETGSLIDVFEGLLKNRNT